ncbi:hypothetical protein [Streptomyces sp. SM11]|uniref:hypothetical protein n=1 Tax=Streptomyces sp. SM11 TaxID=565557 RepID=UPI000CD5C1D2|nr:hypothetical protein [Streptomyces sp. SM11]
MLQCTAVTQVPPDEVLSALTTSDGQPDEPPDGLGPDHFLLCELAGHDEHIEHAAHLWPAETPSAPAPWFFWTGTGADLVHRVDTVPWCPAVLRHLGTGVVRLCAFFDHHVAPHSWSVTDPLGDLIAERVVSDDHGHEGPDRPGGRPQP